MKTSNYIEFTNLGVIDKDKIKFGNINAKKVIGYSCLNNSPFYQIALSSFDGSVTMSSLMRCSKENKMKIDKLFDEMSKIITGFSHDK